MSQITVFEFLVPNINEGARVPTKGKATREMVESLFGEVIEGTGEVIDDSLLCDTGRYYPPGSKDQPNQ